MFDKVRRLLAGETKRSVTGPLIALHQAGRPQWTPRNYAALAQEGFASNAIGYRCVRMIAEAAGSLPWLMYEGDREIAAHPLLDLLTVGAGGYIGGRSLEKVAGTAKARRSAGFPFIRGSDRKG